MKIALKVFPLYCIGIFFMEDKRKVGIFASDK